MNALSKITLPQTAFQLGVYFLIEKQSDLTTRQLGVLMRCAEGMQTVRGNDKAHLRIVLDRWMPGLGDMI